MVKFGIKDRRILSLLDMNARMPMGELAKKAGVSRQVAAYRVERMRKEGVILGAITIFDSVVVGFNWFRVVIRLKGAGSAQKRELIEYFTNHPNTLWVADIGGNWDVIVNIVTRDNFEFNGLFEDFLAKYGKFVKAYEALVYISVRDKAREYILGGEAIGKTGRYTEFNHRMRFNPDLRLDQVDREIIRMISQDVFCSIWQIAARIGVSDKTVKARISRMEKNGLILGYRLLVHPSALGYESYMTLLQMNYLQGEREDELNNFLRSSPNVIHIVKHLGRWRMGIEGEFKDRMEFQDFLIRLRDRFGDIITDFETFPIFRDYMINYFPPGNLV
ncbi:MAG: Lrp/AsnC family transcriptional regulator [Candidatus Micrarchaeota archaeon]